MNIFKKIGNAIISPTQRGKIRWMFTGILAMTLFSAVFVYPKGYNSIIRPINSILPEALICKVGPILFIKLN
jgi:hypothetical protein